MKKQKNKVKLFITTLMFVIMMGISFISTNQGANFSFSGYIALASGNTSGGCSPGSEPGGLCCAIWQIEYSTGQTPKCYLGGSYNCFSGC